jgi:hypothetical protein
MHFHTAAACLLLLVVDTPFKVTLLSFIFNVTRVYLIFRSHQQQQQQRRRNVQSIVSLAHSVFTSLSFLWLFDEKKITKEKMMKKFKELRVTLKRYKACVRF